MGWVAIFWTTLAVLAGGFSIWFGGSLALGLITGDRNCRTWECPVCLTFLSAVIAICGYAIWLSVGA